MLAGSVENHRTEKDSADALAPSHAPFRHEALFVAIYALLFCLAFSSIGNFGVLARQRVQLLPFLLALLAARPRIRRLEAEIPRIRAPSVITP